MDATIIDHNPALKKPIMIILSLCAQGASQDAAQSTWSNRLDIEEAAADQWQPAFRFSPMATIDALIRANAVEERVLLNGEAYNGSLEDMQLDESVPDDAIVESSIIPTASGLAMLATYAPEATLRELFDTHTDATHPGFTDVYLTALRACDTESAAQGEASAVDGCSRDALEAAIKAMPALQPDPETKQTKVYPQYFIDALESAGGIEWNAGWRITPAGKAIAAEVAAQASQPAIIQLS